MIADADVVMRDDLRFALAVLILFAFLGFAAFVVWIVTHDERRPRS